MPQDSNIMIWTLLASLAIILLIVCPYYFTIYFKSDSATTQQREKLRDYLHPLPVIAAIFAAAAAFITSTEANRTAVKAADWNRKEEIHKTARTSEKLYSQFLTSLEHAYVLSANLADNIITAQYTARQIEGLPAQYQHFNPEVNVRKEQSALNLLYNKTIDAMKQSQNDLVKKLLNINEKFVALSYNSFSRFCYSKKWKLLKESKRLRIQTIKDSAFLSMISDDFIRVSSFILIGAQKLYFNYQQTDQMEEYYYPYVEESQKVVRNLLEFPNKKIHFLFLGSTAHHVSDTRVFSGAAILADLMMSVPNGSDIKTCLREYYIAPDNHPHIEKYKEIFHAKDIIPTLYYDVTMLEDSRFQYDPTSSH